MSEDSENTVNSVISQPFQFFKDLRACFFRKYKQMLHFVIEMQVYYMRVTN